MLLSDGLLKSMSTSSTFQPIAASAVVKLIAVVVLPTPPF